MKNKIIPTGATNYSPELSGYEKKIAIEYFDLFNVTGSISRDEFVKAIAEAMGDALSQVELKEINRKKKLIDPLEKAISGYNTLISGLKEINGFALSCLQDSVREEREYLSYDAVRQLNSPLEYNENILKIQLEVLQKTMLKLKGAAPLKKQDWKVELAKKIAQLHQKITGDLPPIYKAGTLGAKPPFYDFATNVTYSEHFDELTIQAIYEALNELKTKFNI